MQRKSLTYLSSMVALAAGFGSALAFAPACSNTPTASGTAGSGATVGGMGNTAGAAVNGGNATAGANASGGNNAMSGAGGSSSGGVTAGGTSSGGTGGGGSAPPCKAVTPLNGSGLTLKATDISAFTYVAANGFAKMAYDPVGKVVVLLKQDGSMSSFDPNVALPTTASTAPVTTAMAYNSGYTANGPYADHRGIVFGPDGALYVLAVSGGDNVGVNIKKGVPGAGGGARTWTTLVTTSMGFPAGHTDYDHSFSGIAISPDGQSLYFSSGSRTEHGEVENGQREVPLSSAIFKVPTATPTDLKNTDNDAKPFMFADGTRNTFDLAFNAAGDLFGTENGPDIDLPDEINFLQAGKHYGFPFRFGNTDSPVLDPAYDPAGDKRLNGGYGAVKNGLYKYDAGLVPLKPAGVTFADPIVNMGPDAVMARADRNAEAVATPGMSGITGHRSPLGISFDTAGMLCGDYYKSGFVLSYGALVASVLGDGGEDLLLIQPTKTGDTYTMKTKQIVTGIKTPMDSVLIGNKLFTAGLGGLAKVFVFVLPTP